MFNFSKWAAAISMYEWLLSGLSESHMEGTLLLVSFIVLKL